MRLLPPSLKLPPIVIKTCTKSNINASWTYSIFLDLVTSFQTNWWVLKITYVNMVIETVIVTVFGVFFFLLFHQPITDFLFWYKSDLFFKLTALSLYLYFYISNPMPITISFYQSNYIFFKAFQSMQQIVASMIEDFNFHSQSECISSLTFIRIVS